MAVKNMFIKVCANAKTRLVKFFKTDQHNGVFYVVILILLNVFALSYNARWDITSDGIYSLSEASERAVKNLNEPFTVKVFFTDDLPAPYSNVRLSIGDLLAEYKSSADRNFTYEFIDMSVATGKQSAQSYGIPQVQVRHMENDSVSAKAAYMGMVFIHGDVVEKLPQVGSQKGLEYQVTTIIQNMRGKIDMLTTMDAIEVTLYASKEIAPFGIGGFTELEATVREVVSDINEENSGKIVYTFESSPSSDAIDALATSAGVSPMEWKEATLPDGKKIAAGKGVLAVVIETGGKKRAINLPVAQTFQGNVIADLDLLGDNINSAINSLLSNSVTIGYVVSGGTKPLQSQNQQQGASPTAGEAVATLLSDMYDIVAVDLRSGFVKDGIDTLIINAPVMPLTPKELYAIDNFVMRGGSILFFIDSFYEQRYGQGQSTFVPLQTGVSALLTSYGVTVNQDYVLDVNSYVVEQPGTPPMNLYFAPDIYSDGLSDNSVATRYLKNMLMVKVSSITLDTAALDSAGVIHDILVKTSPQSWLLSGNIDLNPQFHQPPAEKEMQSYPVAVLLEGTFSSYFKDGKPVDEEDGSLTSDFAVNTHISQGVESAKIAVVSGSEITTPGLHDIKATEPDKLFAYNNALFIHNLVDSLNGFEDVPAMRSKGLESSLKEVSDTSKSLFKVVNIAALPLLSIIIGLFVWRLRVARRKRIEKIFSSEVK